MQSLNDLVRSGKVLYLGVSDTPGTSSFSVMDKYTATDNFSLDRRSGQRVRPSSRSGPICRLVSRLGVSLAEANVSSQGQWNLASRDFERDVLPMCRANGMGVGKSSQLSVPGVHLTR
jgi:aryl-alcohol dehydrogenase-like predicted oxidoreductase